MKRWHWALLLLLLFISLVVEFFFLSHSQEEGSHWWSSIPAFWILFGAAGSMTLIILAKLILGPVLYQREDDRND